MPKKDLTQAAAASADVFDAITSGGALNTQPASDTENTENTKSRRGRPPKQEPEDEKVEYYRFNLKMPLEYEEYLKEAAYRESSPTKTVTVTEYINNLIYADMEKHKGKDNG